MDDRRITSFDPEIAKKLEEHPQDAPPSVIITPALMGDKTYWVSKYIPMPVVGENPIKSLADIVEELKNKVDELENLVLTMRG